jgi:hypothetical protein
MSKLGLVALINFGAEEPVLYTGACLLPLGMRSGTCDGITFHIERFSLGFTGKLSGKLSHSERCFEFAGFTHPSPGN